MIGPGEVTAVVQRLVEHPAVLGLGDLEVRRVFPSCCAGHGSLLLENPAGAVLYVVELQLGPTDDLHVIRLVERWAAVRRRHADRRCFAVLVAEQIEVRYLNILRLIGRAVPVVAMEMRDVDGLLRFTPIRLR